MSKSGRKSSKELEKERPPWRTVVIAPPSKVNKNALLKAKILDATRRALLAQKINHIGTQTDAYATLMREKSIGVQKDLIQMLDKSADTDGTITIRKDRPGGCKYLHIQFSHFSFKNKIYCNFSVIITQTVGQMTENISSTTIATQTPLPKTYLSFASMAQTKTKWHSDSQFTPFELQMLENELLLQTQRNALKAVDSKLNGHRYNDLKAFDDNSMHKQATVKDVQQNSNFQNILPSGTSDVSQHFEIDSIAMKMVHFYTCVCFSSGNYILFFMDHSGKIRCKMQHLHVGMNLISQTPKVIYPIYQERLYPMAARHGTIFKIL